MSLNKFINVNHVNLQIKEYGKNPPFDYVVLDDFFKPEIAEKLHLDFPDVNDGFWQNYNNAIEIKQVCNDWNKFPPNTYKSFSFLNSQPFLDYICEAILPELTLYPDSGLNGGGWHSHQRGGKLNTHLDYSLHPKLKLQRKLNIIIYINPNWKKEWGGALGFWDNKSAMKPGNLITSIWPKFNRAVIFDTTQNSWHGLPEPLICPENESRKSLAAYFLCKPPVKVDKRSKALYSPTKEQENNTEILELIKNRSDVKTASKYYVWPDTKK